MGNNNSPRNDELKIDTDAERQLRGDAMTGSQRKAAANHAEYEKTRDPDTELHLDGEDEGLYSDGLDIKDNSDTLSGTRGNSPAAIKP